MEPTSIKFEELNEELIQHAIRFDLGICRDLYHGTTKYAAHKITDSKTIKPGKDTGYLGYGIYCYLHDDNASRAWARNKYRHEKIAVCKIVANLGNGIFVDKELFQYLRGIIEHVSRSPITDINEEVGTLLEEIIEDHLEREFNTTIHTVGRTYKVGIDDRPATMYALRKEGMVKDVKLHWEES